MQPRLHEHAKPTCSYFSEKNEKAMQCSNSGGELKALLVCA